MDERNTDKAQKLQNQKDKLTGQDKAAKGQAPEQNKGETTYRVVGGAVVGGKQPGETVTAKELSEQGANVESLIAGGHLEETGKKRDDREQNDDVEVHQNLDAQAAKGQANQAEQKNEGRTGRR